MDGDIGGAVSDRYEIALHLGRLRLEAKMWVGEIYDESFSVWPSQGTHVGQPPSLALFFELSSLTIERTVNVQSPAERTPYSSSLVYTRGSIERIEAQGSIAAH